MNNKLRDLFQQPFDLVTYRSVILSQLLHAQRLLTSPEMLEQYDNGDQLYGLGYLTDNEGKEIGLYYTHVPNGDVRRKRVGFRKMLHPYVKYGVDAAVAVFDDGEHWRLSYICDLKGGVTSAKRFSYVFGDPKGQYNTPVSRLTDLAQKRLTIDELHKTFSVDALSKEFFDEYHRHYDRIIAELARQGNTGAVFHDYVKKMMGRIVFLHFLQKKGWLNDDPEFLSKLFFLSPYKQDFLEQELEPLFFGIFNTEPDKREQLFSQEHWDLRWLAEWEKLPYLNGGLFERDEVDKMKIKLPASLFENLFKFMASYNFTIDENDPDDADIGIDPEMLGKIFESLLEDNKAKGAFYTPKEIVRYMCKESLIAYLGTQATGLSKESGEQATSLSKESGIQATGLSKELGAQATGLSKEPGMQATGLSKEPGTQATGLSKEIGEQATGLSGYIRKFVEQHEFPEELEPYREVLDTALRNVKICDPAIGSGAFPMGLLNELWRCREALGERATSPSQMGTQATGLSQAGSLCSKEGQAGSLYPYSRAALKREIIENNIYGVDIEKGAIDIARLRFWLSIVVDAEKPEPLPNFDYKFMQGNSLIESFDGHDLSHIMESGSRSIPGRSTRKSGWAENQTGMEFGSDEVKQNLRNWLKMYFSLTDHKEKAYYRELINSSVKHYIVQQGIGPAAETRLNAIDPSANKDFFLWHTWFKDIFDNGGFDIVIGNPPYFKYEGNNKNEINIIRKTQYLDIAFGGKLNAYKLFLALSIKKICKSKGIISLIFQNSFIADKQASLLRKEVIDKHQIITIDSFPERDSKKKRVFENVKMSVCILMMKKSITGKRFNVNFWNDKYKSSGTRVNFSADEIKRIDSVDYCIPRIEQNSVPLVIKLRQMSKLPLKCYEGELNMTFHKYLFNNNPSNPTILKGAAIQRYYITYNMSQGEIEYLDEKRFLLHNNTEKAYHHEIERLAMQGMTGANDKIRLVMTIVPRGVYLANSCNYIIPTEKLPAKYLLGLMNSRLMNWYFRCFSTNSNVNGYEVENFPMPIDNTAIKSGIIELVNSILHQKEHDISADTSTLEHQLDRLVYQLYNLTPEEIEIIEQ